MLTVADLRTLLDSHPADAFVLLVDGLTGVGSPLSDEILTTPYPTHNTGAGREAILLRSIRTAASTAVEVELPEHGDLVTDAGKIKGTTGPGTVPIPPSALTGCNPNPAQAADPTLCSGACGDDPCHTHDYRRHFAEAQAAKAAQSIAPTADTRAAIFEDAAPSEPRLVVETSAVGVPPTLHPADPDAVPEAGSPCVEPSRTAPAGVDFPPAPGSSAPPVTTGGLGAGGPAGKVLPMVTIPPSRWLTNSRLKVARRCAREHHYIYNLGIKSTAESDATRFGDLIHRSLEAYFKAPDAEARLELALEAIKGMDAERASKDRAPLDPFEVARARVLVMGYHLMWKDEPYEVLAVEKEFSGAPLVNPETGGASSYFARAGKIDLLLRDLRDGRLIVADHKTSSEDISTGSPYWTKMRVDSQVGAYFLGAQHLGYDRPDAWLHDVLRKPGERPHKATPREKLKWKKDGTLYANMRERDETPEEYGERIAEGIAADPSAYYVRATIVRLDSEMEQYERDVWEEAAEIRARQEANRHPRNVDACVRFSSTCAFFPVCTGEASLDDPTRYRKTDPDAVHQELTPVKAAADVAAPAA